MPTRTTSIPQAAATTEHPLPDPQPDDDGAQGGQSWAPAIALVSVVGLSYTALIGTFVGHVL
jgi:hypothetical protein